MTITNVTAGILILFFSANADAGPFIAYMLRKSNAFIGANIPVTTPFIIGFFGAINVITSSFQFLFRFEERSMRLEERSMRHAAAHAEYLNAHRKVERILTRTTDRDLNDDLHKLNERMNYLEKYSPVLADRHYTERSWIFWKKQPLVIHELDSEIKKLQALFDECARKVPADEQNDEIGGFPPALQEILS